MFKAVTRPVVFLWRKFTRLSGKKKILIVLILVGLVGFGWNRYQNSKKTPDYDLVTVERGSLVEVVNETGHVTAAGATPVYSTTTGMVEAVYVKNGDMVVKDAVLFKVISTATKQEKDAALSNYLAAKSAYETAKATELSLQAAMFTQWDEFKELAQSDDYEDADGNPRWDQRNLPEFHVPEKEWLAAEANYKKQATVVSQTSANLSAAWQAYQATQDSEVKAVLGGEVRNLAITRGDRVAVGSAANLSSVSPVLILLDPEVEISVKLDVSESDAVKIQEGQEAQIEFDAIATQTFSGKVDRVDTLATPAGGVVNYSIYVVLNDKNQNVRSGMTADVDITVAQKDNVLLVPSTAVKPFEGGRAVRVVGTDGQIEFVPVVTGSRGNGSIEIVSGIEEGAEVIEALSNEQVERKSMSFF